MEEVNPTKKQHFVPQFYLKNFADAQGKLQALDIKNKRIGNPHPYQSFRYEHYFYAVETGVPDEVSQYVEQWLNQIESRVALELPRIIGDIVGYKHIHDDDRYILAALMSLLWLRSPGMRKQLNAMHTDLTKQMMRFYAPERVGRFAEETDADLSQLERRKIVEMMKSGSYDLQFNNAQHLRFMMESLGYGEPGFTNMFFGMNWKIYLGRGSECFITMDSPVIEWFLPPQTFYGASFLERSKYFSLTPEILLELTYPVTPRKATRETLFKKDDDRVKTFNMLLVSHAQFAYSSHQGLLNRLLAGCMNPGLLEKAYYERYERPWSEYHMKKARSQRAV